MGRDRLFTVRVAETEAESLAASCARTGVTMSDAYRAFLVAMSGGEVAVISTDDGPLLVPGPAWTQFVERIRREQ